MPPTSTPTLRDTQLTQALLRSPEGLAHALAFESSRRGHGTRRAFTPHPLQQTPGHGLQTRLSPPHRPFFSHSGFMTFQPCGPSQHFLCAASISSSVRWGRQWALCGWSKLAAWEIQTHRQGVQGEHPGSGLSCSGMGVNPPRARCWAHNECSVDVLDGGRGAPQN